MKVYEIQGSDIETLRLVDRPDPKPGNGQVVVRIHATSLNYRDLLILAGNYGASSQNNVIPLSDGAGAVVAIGEGVTRVKVGDRVAATFFQTWFAGALTRQRLNHYALKVHRFLKG